MSITVDRLDPLNTDDVRAAAVLLSEAFADHSIVTALNAWDKQIMVDTYVHHLAHESGTWLAYLAKKRTEGVGEQGDGAVVGVAVVVPPGKDYTDVPEEVQERIPEDVRRWQRDVLFPATHRLDEESFGPDGMQPFFHLALLGVDPDARRFGVGKTLLNHLIATAEESHATMSLNCEANGLIDYYRRFGFVTLKQGDVPISLDGETTGGYCMIHRAA